MTTSVLKLDASGHPVAWIGFEKAAYYVTKGLVAWDSGANHQVLHGGHNDQGLQSRLELPSIMAIKGRVRKDSHNRTVALEKRLLFKRDRYTCAYCGGVFKECDLEMEHIHPESRGGLLTWMNIVASCRGCNSRKADRTPEEARMPLLYVPYVPNMHEGLILSGRRILADQMEWLASGLPRHSRMRDWAHAH